jgi:hypothetical protein
LGSGRRIEKGAMRLSRRSFLGIVGLAFAPHAFSAPQDEAGPGSLVPARGVVFTGASSRLLAGTFIASKGLGDAWDPQPEEIAQLESVLSQELTKRLQATNSTTKDQVRARDYYRQYAGIHLDGQKLIFINGFYKSNVEDTARWLAKPRPESQLDYFPAQARNRDFWHFVPVQVMDGGDHYFQAFYDPVRRKLVGFQFNGVA